MNSIKKGHLMELPNRVLIGHNIIGEFGSFLENVLACCNVPCKIEDI